MEGREEGPRWREGGGREERGGRGRKGKEMNKKMVKRNTCPQTKTNHGACVDTVQVSLREKTWTPFAAFHSLLLADNRTIPLCV